MTPEVMENKKLTTEKNYQLSINNDKVKERRDIPTVDPVSLNGVRYEALDGGYVKAVDEKTGTEKWLVKIYDAVFDRELDKQEIFIGELKLAGDDLHVITERNDHYLVNIKTHAVNKWEP